MAKQFPLKSSAGALFLAVVGISLVAAPSSSAQDSDGNWMAEFVRLRVAEQNLRAIGPSISRAAVADAFRPQIVGGTNAGPTDNPFQVALLNGAVTNNADAQFCGGTLVRPNFVVTAAHCSDFVTANQVQVLTGTRRLDGTGARRDVLRIVIHPNWNSNNMDNDVAVWELSTAETGIPLAGLATEDGPVGAKLLTTGWGALTEGGASPIDLQRVNVPLVQEANCNDANSYRGNLTQNMICAGFDAGGLDSCQGDSGGPLTRGNNNSILTGIVSWGWGCALPNLYGVYTRVSMAGIRNFIEGVIEGVIQPATCRGMANTKVGTSGNDVINGTSSVDVISGLGGDDIINGLEGNDRICGDDGNDNIRGGVGNDIIAGGPGTDTAAYVNSASPVTASISTNTATGEGSDTFKAIENLAGSRFADALTGHGGMNVLDGLSGNDKLKGARGNDTLNGNKGNDTMNGGGGTDTCNGGPGSGDTRTACETMSGVP